MSDKQILEWIESHKAQLWWDRHRKLWTCQVIYHPHVIQPSRATLRACIVDAASELEKLQIS